MSPIEFRNRDVTSCYVKIDPDNVGLLYGSRLLRIDSVRFPVERSRQYLINLVTYTGAHVFVHIQNASGTQLMRAGYAVIMNANILVANENSFSVLRIPRSDACNAHFMQISWTQSKLRT